MVKLDFKLDTHSKKTGVRNFRVLWHRSSECSDRLTNSAKCITSF